MRRIFAVLSAAALVIGVADAVAGAAPVLSVASIPSAASVEPVASSATTAGAGRVVTFTTGQRVLLQQAPGAAPVLGALPGSPWGGRDSLIGATMGGHVYAFPHSAIPYLGYQLDPSLFDVTALARYEDAAGAGRIPLSVNGPPPRGVDNGSLSTAAAPQFGAALRTAPPTAGVRLAGTPSVVTPAFDMSTLTIDTVDQNGNPAYGVLTQLLNVDDAAKDAITTGTGLPPTRFSVPVGHYSPTAVFVTVENGQVVFRTDVHPQFTVRGDTTVVADARRATSELSAAVGRPAQRTAKTVTVVRSARINGGMGIFSADQPSPGGPPARFLVSSTGKATVGDLRYDAYWHDAPPDAGASYTYDFDFPSDGSIPAAQAHPADDAALATVEAHYDADAPTEAAAGRGILSGAGLTFVGFVPLYPIDTPASRPEYVSAAPDVHWQSSVLRSTEGVFTDWSTDSIRTYRAGTTTPAEWLRQPLHPGPARSSERWFEPLI